MLVTSHELLGRAKFAAESALTPINYVRRENATRPLDDLRLAEANLVQALAELRAARWGIERRMPQFDDKDLDLLLEHECVALRSARGLIPLAGEVQ